MSNSSEILLHRYIEGSQKAASALFDRYRLRVIGLVRKRMASTGLTLSGKFDADDIAQETFMAFFDLADRDNVRWNRCGDLWRLLAGIAINKVNASLGHAFAEKRNALRERGGVDNNEDFELQATQDELSAANELSELIEDLLQNAKPLLGAILRLRLAGCTQDEIAERVRRSPRTVRRLIDLLKTKIILEHDEQIQLRSEQEGLCNSSSLDSSSLDSSSLDSSSLDPSSLDRKGTGASEWHSTEIDFSDLHLLRMVGSGSFAKVYAARQLSADRLVAVKIMRKKWRDNREVLETFSSEVSLLRRFCHPCIVRTFGDGILPNGNRFLVLEYIPGRSLDIAAENATVCNVAGWFLQLANGIEYLHSRNVSHGDLRFDNVLIDEANTVRIIDFGLSSLASFDGPSLERGMGKDLAAFQVMIIRAFDRMRHGNLVAQCPSTLLTILRSTNRMTTTVVEEISDAIRQGGL